MFLCNKTVMCHLDRNCYGTVKAPFHPIGCKSKIFSSDQSMNCLQKRPLVIVGDSRSFELFTGVKLKMLDGFHSRLVKTYLHIPYLGIGA